MKVSNPLTIIAIFAGLAETLATVALVKLPLEIQQIFVYFVIAFPSGIVLLFFFVLYFKNIVLYAPSDFDDQNHYLEANHIKKTLNERVDEIFSEINKNGMRLTKEEIERAKNRLGDSIDKTVAISNREKDILELLEDGPASLTSISNHVNASHQSVARSLHKLVQNGYLEQVKDASGKTTWSLGT
ncbi:winged helix-turn-helix domain-containing protein [Shewanella sp. AS16]|uniref:winged helix-turn-helix domain-containing protein n=1 Tax=Shewanella sp. AS16 TaxID=2907625 RepID=UPI001F336913|nr:winged helix-turn-helix domain-containing protein [Shewanella sp. AS16]MCE9684626.1 winged helix-turn-helix domain-containing protein [Shewanella sp. AS16]